MSRSPGPGCVIGPALLSITLNPLAFAVADRLGGRPKAAATA